MEVEEIVVVVIDVENEDEEENVDGIPKDPSLQGKLAAVSAREKGSNLMTRMVEVGRRGYAQRIRELSNKSQHHDWMAASNREKSK